MTRHSDEIAARARIVRRSHSRRWCGESTRLSVCRSRYRTQRTTPHHLQRP